MYASLPGWALVNARVAVSVIGDPLCRATRGLSDHVPVKVVFSNPVVCSRGVVRQIPPWIFKLPCFELILKELVDYLRVEQLSGIARWTAHKFALREAARRARNAALAGLAVSPHTKLLMMQSVARSVWRQDLGVARTLLLTCPGARSLLAVVDQKYFSIPRHLRLAFLRLSLLSSRPPWMKSTGSTS